MSSKYLVAALLVAVARRAGFGAVGQGRHRSVAARRLFGRGRDLAAACGEAATPTRSSTSARPIASAAACRSTSRAAKIWFERAARQGPCRRRRPRSACCCSRTATRPRASNGSRRPPSKASRARCWSMAPRCYNGDGVTQDPVLGYAYVSRAAAQGLRAGQGNAGAARPADAARPTARRRVALAHAKAKAAPAPQPRSRRKAKPAKRRKPSRAGQASRRRSRRRPPSRAGRAARRAAPGGSSSAPSRSAARPKRSTASLPARRRWPGAALIISPAGAVTRLQVGPFASRAAAAAAAARSGRPASPSPRK